MEDWIDLRSEWPGLRGDGLHAVDGSLWTELRAALLGLGFDVVTLHGSRVHDDRSFFAEATRAFSFPPHFGDNWDALVDSLGELGGRDTRRLAVLWTDAHLSLASDTETVLLAVRALTDAAQDLECEPGEGPPLQLEVFLLGMPPAFSARPRFALR
jgi:RNAse (barnase) inhibitor barstar